MHRTQSHRSKGKNLKRKKRFMSSVKGVSHLSRQAKRRLYCKLQLWMWRKQREKFRFGIFRTKKRACGISSGSCHSLKAQSQKNKKKVLMQHMLNLKISQARSLAVASPLGCATKSSEDALNQKRPQGSGSLSETSTDSSSLQNQVTNTTVTADTVIQTVSSQKTETVGHFSDGSNPSNHCHTVKPLLSTDSGPCGGLTRLKAPRTMMPPQRFEVSCPSGQQPTVIPGQHQALSRDTDESFTSKTSSQSDLSIKALTKNIHDFLSDFYRRYGSFIPLQKSDVLRHLKRKFNTDFNDRKTIIFSEIAKSRTAIVQKPVSCFQVIYKKHTLTLEDLSTLADQNWLNDQVMNMYGELIVESSHHKVHFLNSFFHRQLMTKGYDGVKRWTKQVDLFSKTLLLVPIHLEVHWCLVTADLVKKKVCLYDSQGIALQKVARNILKYLMTEAKEKKQAAFENGWAVSLDEQKIPQQTNENDCGVFVLEYSRCLALAKPLQFSQEDIPKIRKRIYKELCDCRLHDER